MVANLSKLDHFEQPSCIINNESRVFSSWDIHSNFETRAGQKVIKPCSTSYKLHCQNRHILRKKFSKWHWPVLKTRHAPRTVQCPPKFWSQCHCRVVTLPWMLKGRHIGLSLVNDRGTVVIAYFRLRPVFELSDAFTIKCIFHSSHTIYDIFLSRIYVSQGTYNWLAWKQKKLTGLEQLFMRSRMCITKLLIFAP